MKINGLSTNIYKPEKPANKLAIIFPGYLDSKDYDHLVALGKALSQAGYLAVSFDPTGTWDSEGQIDQYSVTQYLKDIKKLLSTLEEDNKQPFKEVILLGHSMGGQVALLYGARRPQDISAVIGIMPSSDPLKVASFIKHIPEWQKTGSRLSTRDIPGKSEGLKEFVVPYEFIKDRKSYDTLAEIKNYKGRTLLLAGELDDTTPPAIVQEIYEHANEPKEFDILPGIDHGYRRSQEKIAVVNKKILEFLK